MSRRWVYTFQPRFHEGVTNGSKRTTIRGIRKDGFSPAPGDLLSLRAWLGRPRASKQRLLRPECPCVAVQTITITRAGIRIGKGVARFKPDEDAIAKADGFKDGDDMLAWFRETHGLPFQGILIQW